MELKRSPCLALSRGLAIYIQASLSGTDRTRFEKKNLLRSGTDKLALYIGSPAVQSAVFSPASFVPATPAALNPPRGRHVADEGDRAAIPTADRLPGSSPYRLAGALSPRRSSHPDAAHEV